MMRGKLLSLIWFAYFAGVHWAFWVAGRPGLWGIGWGWFLLLDLVIVVWDAVQLWRWIGIMTQHIEIMGEISTMLAHRKGVDDAG